MCKHGKKVRRWMSQNMTHSPGDSTPCSVNNEHKMVETEHYIVEVIYSSSLHLVKVMHQLVSFTKHSIGPKEPQGCQSWQPFILHKGRCEFRCYAKRQWWPILCGTWRDLSWPWPSPARQGITGKERTAVFKHCGWNFWQCGWYNQLRWILKFSRDRFFIMCK